jgi:hypothetical protein
MLGLTRSGKTETLKHLITQDLVDRSTPKGVIVIGPDHQLFEYLADCVPAERHNDVLYFNPANVYGHKVIGWNPLEFSDAHDLPESQWRPLYQQKVGSVYKVLSRSLESVTEPQKELLLEAIYGLVALEQVALKDFDTLLDPKNPALRNAIINTRRIEERTRRYWRDYDDDPAHEASAVALRKKFVSLFHEPLATLFASPAFTWSELLAQPRIIFVDLSTIPSPAKETVAEMVLAEIEVEISRREYHKREKIPIYLYVDEFADFINAGESTNELFAKARKNWLAFTLAHQVSRQITPKIRAIVEGNAQTCIALRLSHHDAPSFAKKMQLHLFNEEAYNAVYNRRGDAFSRMKDERIRELESRERRDQRVIDSDIPLGVYEKVMRRREKNDDLLSEAIRMTPSDEVEAQWRKEAERAAYDSDCSAELLMNLQPGQAVIQIPGDFGHGIPVKIPLPPHRRGNAQLLEYSVERWGVSRTSAGSPRAAEDEPSDTGVFDDEHHEQFLQQKPKRRTRNRD